MKDAKTFTKFMDSRFKKVSLITKKLKKDADDDDEEDLTETVSDSVGAVVFEVECD